MKRMPHVLLARSLGNLPLWIAAGSEAFGVTEDSGQRTDVSIPPEKPTPAVNLSPKQPDYYFEGGLLVYTAAFHLKRGSCCGSGCRHCPYEPRHVEGTRKTA